MCAVAATSADSLVRGLVFLEEARLIRPSDAGVDGEYRFKHSLVQETAYGGLLRDRRMALHHEVAEAILRLNPEAAASQPAVLAFHFFHAGDADKAFRFALRAGDQARLSYAYQEALANYDLALGVADRLAGAEYGP